MSNAKHRCKVWRLWRSGSYRRKVRQAYLDIKTITEETGYTNETAAHEILRSSQEISTNDKSSLIHTGEGSAGSFFSTNNADSIIDETLQFAEVDSDDDCDEHRQEFNDYEKTCDYGDEIRNWALKHNVTHAALKDLLKILNKKTPNTMPNDPRTLLNTPREIKTTFVNPGEYWHNGLKKCIVKKLEKTTEIPEQISISVNIDGLPIHNSSKKQFWPILCSILEKPEFQPIICGIYLGSAKPKDLNVYFTPFLDKMCDILQNGVEVRNKHVQIQFRCFVCDSPARAMIKGVCNFNGKHGCLKCTVVGEYSHVSHTVIFPGIDCALRNDKDFREKKYGDHHKEDSPLLRLPIDMVEDFPVADSLHLIDLGIMRRLIIGWRDGNFGKKNTKWRATDIQTVNNFLHSCMTPTEIHRSVRGLDELRHWKGSEYRTFFYYLSVVILRKVLKQEAMNHFLTLFCAVTICSSEEHLQFLSLAEDLFKYFVAHYKNFYGIDYLTSNVHNLTHVVHEVRRFGKLETFNAYKFENKLYLIKNLLRQGNKPLAQVAKRLIEQEYIEDERNRDRPITDYPYVKKNLRNGNLLLYFKDFVLSTKRADKYFLTTKREIMEINNIEVKEIQINIHCNKFHQLQNVFDLPINSSYLNIFKCKDDIDLRTELLCFPCDVKCKLVATKCESDLYFFPLLHTL